MPDSRPLLVGEAPPAGVSGPYVALSGRSGRRLAQLAGLDPVTALADPASAHPEGHGPHYVALVSAFRPVNLLDELPVGPWPRAQAKVAALGLIAAYGGVPFVLLGRKVAAAFGHPLDYWQWRRGVVSVPHPSGLNRVLNDPGAQIQTGEALRGALRRAERRPGRRERP